jgi:hypothetical protein
MISLRPLKNAPFCPIPASGSNFNPKNTQCIPVVKIFAFLGLEQNGTFCKGLVSMFFQYDPLIPFLRPDLLFDLIHPYMMSSARIKPF